MESRRLKPRLPRNEADALSAATLDQRIVEKLFGHSRVEKHAAGHNLFLQDDPGDELHLLVAGTVEISIYSSSGKKLVANIITTGGMIGEIGALDGGRRTATATCVSGCEVRTVKRTQLLQRIENDAQLATAFINLLCARVRWVSGELGDHAHLKIEQRLAKRLALMAKLFADPEGWIKIPQSDLAEFLGATRESINKIITSWKREKLLESKRGSFRLLRPDRLKQIAMDEGD